MKRGRSCQRVDTLSASLVVSSDHQCRIHMNDLENVQVLETERLRNNCVKWVLRV